MYLLRKIRIARYNRIHYKEGNKDKRIGYCKNRGLIYAITLIGHHHVKDPKKSAYKNGIIYLQEKLNENRTDAANNQHHISKAEIRAAMRPHSKRKHSLKIPMDIERIVNKTTEVVSSTPAIHNKCREMNHSYAESYNVRHLLCYRFLIGSLIKRLEIIHGAMNDNAFIRDLYNSLSGNHRLCR